MTCTKAWLPITAVNIDVAIPSISTTAKPRTAPAPNSHSTKPAMNAVMFESAAEVAANPREVDEEHVAGRRRLAVPL